MTGFDAHCGVSNSNSPPRTRRTPRTARDRCIDIASATPLTGRQSLASFASLRSLAVQQPDVHDEASTASSTSIYALRRLAWSDSSCSAGNVPLIFAAPRRISDEMSTNASVHAARSSGVNASKPPPVIPSSVLSAPFVKGPVRSGFYTGIRG